MKAQQPVQMKAQPKTSEPRVSVPPLGTRIVAGGRELFIHRSGAGGPAVVILPGAGTVGLDYFNIHEDVARRSTSVLYDRAGTGWSDAVDLPRTSEQVTTELRELLAAAGVAAPYLLVGHSLGGAYARHYAQRFPSEVAGLVLIDPLHEDSTKHWPEAIVQSQQQMAEMPMTALPDALIELYRNHFEEKFRTWPSAVREALMAYHLRAWRTGMLEGKNMEVVCEELRQGGGTPDVPLIVISAMGIDPVQAFVPDSLQRQVNDGNHTVNELLARSVPRGRHIVVADAAHAWITMDRADVVLRAVHDLLLGEPAVVKNVSPFEE